MNSFNAAAITVLYKAAKPSSLLIRPEAGARIPLQSVRFKLPPNDLRSAHNALACDLKRLMALDIPAEAWPTAFKDLQDGVEVRWTRRTLLPFSKERGELEATQPLSQAVMDSIAAARHGHDLYAHFDRNTGKLQITDRTDGHREQSFTCGFVPVAHLRLAEFLEQRFKIAVPPERYNEIFGDLQGRRYSISSLQSLALAP